MGSGKTTVGRALARKLNKRFIDSDHEIEARTGVSIPVIFEIEGEVSFRQREADVIRDLTAQNGIVLATGGGAILNPESLRYLHERGTVIYLRAGINSILQRTRNDKNRPLLRTADPRKKLEELEAQRHPLYQQAAHLIIETGRPNVQHLVQSILDKLPKSFLETHFQPHHTNMHSVQNGTIQTLNLQLGERSYSISIGQELLDDLSLLGEKIRGDHVVIVTNTVVAPLYLGRLEAQFKALDKVCSTVILQDGEVYKNWDNLNLIFDHLLSHKCDRKTTLIALGGGVIGDMTGFAAATYMRGIPFVQIPTTLLSQVDSSVGGKTGINHPLGKNMIGAFYQPQAVIADTSTLNSLPDKELSAGLAEVIKHGAIIDAEFFTWLEKNMTQLRAKDPQALAYVIARSCEIKADVVQQDEREGGLRAILNFGHTFGHAIEAGLGFGVWLHGEAVGCGMVMAAELSFRLGYIDYVSKTRIKQLVEDAGLPVIAPDLGEQRWLELMEVDKKNEGGQIKFILLKPLGASIISSVPEAVLLETLRHCILE